MTDVNGIAQDVLRSFVERIERLEEEKKNELAEAMPELEKLEGMKKEEINASVYKGKEGLKTIHYEFL